MPDYKSQLSKTNSLDIKHFKSLSFKKLTNNYDLYLMLLPVIAYYIIFQYMPIYGLQIAFKDFYASLGIWDSPWSGFKQFEKFFSSYYFWRLMKNTLGISIYTLLLSFPLPIILALLLNEIKNVYFKKIIQNITYIPHFVSVIVTVGMIMSFTSVNNGIVNEIIKLCGSEPINFMIRKEYFKTIYVISHLWEHTGWAAIIYIAALTGINPELYEASIVDGASKLRRIIHISIPGIMPTVIILLILNIGRVLNVGFQKILLMQNPLNMETSDVISTYIYRIGLLQGDYSFSSAVGLFNSAVNLILLISANYIAKRVSDTSLW